MSKRIRNLSINTLLVVFLPAFLFAKDLTPQNFTERPAIFEITTDVVNEDVQAFTFTAGAFGNTLERSGKGSFEPATFANKFMVSKDHADRVYADNISYYDSYQSGFLDRAEVRVYRIINGKMKMVRQDRVAKGGTILEYWSGSKRKIVPSSETTFQDNWAPWSRPGTHRWYTVFSVDKNGKASAPSNVVKLERRIPAKGAKRNRTQKNIRPRGDGSADLPAPSNFRASYNDQGIIEFSWDPVDHPDVAGYRVMKSDTDPQNHRGEYLELEGRASTAEETLQKGDMVIVRKSLVSYDTGWMSNRLANLLRDVRKFIPDRIPNDIHTQKLEERTWRLVKHESNTPIKNAGEYYFELKVQEGETQLVGKHGIPDISTTSQEFYPVPEKNAEYIMEVWMKADKDGRSPVTFTFDGDNRVGGFVGSHPLQVTDQWKKYEVRFRGDNTNEGHHAYFVLKTDGPGIFSFDNFRVYRADTDYLDYLPYQYENLKKSGMSAFRTHGSIKTKNISYTMVQYLSEAGQAEGVAKGNTLGQALKMIRKAAINPWLQIEFHMSPNEWLAFMEYMAAPYNPGSDSKSNKPYAAMRYEQGQDKPWMEEFDKIYFELSNETWNNLFRPWVFQHMTDAATGQRYHRGEVYALMHDHVVEVLRTSPYWKPEYEETFVHVMGGWATSLNSRKGYTQQIAKATRYGEIITIAAYNGGWDEGEGPPQETPASFFNVLSQVNQTAIPRIIKLNKIMENTSNCLGREVKFGAYEAGPGYALNGLNNARVTKEQAKQQEHVMKSKLAGVATIDSFLARAKYGSDIDNFFTFAEGNLWKSHAKKFRGGQPHASYLPLTMFNKLALGDMLLVKTNSVTTVDTAAARRRSAVTNAPLAAVYATRNGDQVNVICINREFSGYPAEAGNGHTVFGIQLPFNQASTVTLYKMTGKPTDTNIHSENVKAKAIPINPSTIQENGQFVINTDTGGSPEGMPPAEMFMYVFKGTNIGAKGRVLSLGEVRQSQPPTFSGQ